MTRAFAIATAPKRDSPHWTAGTVTWNEILAWVEKPGRKKDAGNYLLGTLKPDTTVVHQKGEKPCGPNLHRRKDFVISRSALTLDVDHPEPGFAEKVELLFPYACLLHNTFSSTPDDLRYRMIVPFDRDVAPDEYVAIATSVMQDLGRDQFDPGSSQPERYMFKPAAQRREWFDHLIIDADPMPVDIVLDGFEEDLSRKPLPRTNRTKRDPFTIEGVIGAFNRAYLDWDLLIETYELPYDKVSEDRYHLAGARSQAGMGPIADTEGLVYSHHSNDPAYGKTCSAFDLVRLHRFGHLDENVDSKTPINRLPSHEAMLDLAQYDHRVTAELVGVDFDAVMSEEVTNTEWKLKLRMTPKSGELKDTIHNWNLIRANDPLFGLFYYNELSLSVEVEGDKLPWRPVTGTTRVLTNNDRWNVCFYIEEVYGIRPPRAFMDALVDARAHTRTVNPVRDYLEGLTWDGKSRIETCLPGVEVTPYTRLVARKSMVAAVARMLDPGCKWDHTLVLYGPEGMGKSWWIDKVAKGYSSTLGNIGDKDTLLTMQRSWIMVSDEGHSLRKGDADAQKEFLTRTQDVFRMPYDRETLVHPRHCVIWSTTNDETFLRRQEGNRRFLIVHCENRVDFNSMTDEYVDQLWAEAVYLYRAGEPLYLGDPEAEAAAVERERFVEEDALFGVVSEFLHTRVPDDWWDMSPEGRRQWLLDRSSGFAPPGTHRMDMVCSSQIWVEAFGRRIGEHRRMDLLDITTALKKVPGWKALPGRTRVPGYGPQMVFVRESDG